MSTGKTIEELSQSAETLKAINNTPSLLAQVIEAANLRGFVGVLVLNQGGSCGYIAICVTTGGAFDPKYRGWDTKPTPEEAITELARKLGVIKPNLRDPNYVPTVDEALADPQGFVDGMIEIK